MIRPLQLPPPLWGRVGVGGRRVVAPPAPSPQGPIRGRGGVRSTELPNLAPMGLVRATLIVLAQRTEIRGRRDKPSDAAVGDSKRSKSTLSSPSLDIGRHCVPLAARSLTPAFIAI